KPAHFTAVAMVRDNRGARVPVKGARVTGSIGCAALEAAAGESGPPHPSALPPLPAKGARVCIRRYCRCSTGCLRSWNTRRCANSSISSNANLSPSPVLLLSTALFHPPTPPTSCAAVPPISKPAIWWTMPLPPAVYPHPRLGARLAAPARPPGLFLGSGPVLL